MQSAVTNTVAGQVTRFYRDADGNLVKKSDGAGTVMVVNGVYEEAGGVATSYYTFGGQRVAMRVAGAVYWLHGDHLGSASLTTNVSGQKVAELRYLPFGETRWAWGVTPTDRRYTGQRELAGVGLYDYNARMYWPAAGRFVSADTVAPQASDPQQLNRYAYARNNPLRYNDPTGHDVGCPGQDAGECKGKRPSPRSKTPSLQLPWRHDTKLTFAQRTKVEQTLQQMVRNPTKLANLYADGPAWGRSEDSVAIVVIASETTIGASAESIVYSILLRGLGRIQADAAFVAHNSGVGQAGAAHFDVGSVALGATLVVPEWVKSAGTFVNWTRQLQEQFQATGFIPSHADIDLLVNMAERYGVRFGPPEVGGGDSIWATQRHINFGNRGQGHVPVPDDYRLPPDVHYTRDDYP